MKCAYGTIRNALLHKFAKRICIMAAKPLLHVCEANASFTNHIICDILNWKIGAFMRNDKLSVQSMDFAVVEMLPLSATSQKYSSCKSSIITTPFFIVINI